MIKKKNQPQSLLVIEARREHSVKLTRESFILTSGPVDAGRGWLPSWARVRSEVCSVVWL